MKFVHGALSVVLSLFFVATPSTSASSTTSTIILSSNKKTTNAIYAGYCLGCAAWPAKHDLLTTDDKTAKQLMQPINSHQHHLSAKIKAQIYPTTFMMIQHIEAQQTQQKKRETRLLLLSAPPVVNKSSTTENTVTKTSNVQSPVIIEESTSSTSHDNDDDGGTIYTNKLIFLSIVVLGVAASALSNKKQHQQRQLSEESSNKNILQIKKRILFNNLEVDISENNNINDVLEIELVPTVDDDSVLTITPRSINENSRSSSSSPPAHGVMEQLLKSLSPNSWNSEHRCANIFRDHPNSTTIENTEDDNVSQTSSMLGLSMLMKRMAFNKAFNKWEALHHETILKTDDHMSDEIALIEEAEEEEEEVALQCTANSFDDTITDEDETEVWYHVGSGRIVSAREARAVLAAEGSYQVDDANDTKDTVEMATPPTTMNIVATTQRRVIFPELESQLEEYKYQYNF